MRLPWFLELQKGSPLLPFHSALAVGRSIGPGCCSLSVGSPVTFGSSEAWPRHRADWPSREAFGLGAQWRLFFDLDLSAGPTFSARSGCSLWMKRADMLHCWNMSGPGGPGIHLEHERTSPRPRPFRRVPEAHFVRSRGVTPSLTRMVGWIDP